MKTHQCLFIKRLTIVLILLAATSLSGCVGALFSPKFSIAERMSRGADAPALKVIQSHRFDGLDESELQAASVAVLQDLGFQITRSDTQLGLIIGRKRKGGEEIFREMISDIPDVIKQVTLWELTLGYFPLPPDPKTKIMSCISVVLVIEPEIGIESSAQHIRTTFYHCAVEPMKQDQDIIIWAEVINSRTIYEEFYRRLSREIATNRQRN